MRTTPSGCPPSLKVVHSPAGPSCASAVADKTMEIAMVARRIAAEDYHRGMNDRSLRGHLLRLLLLPIAGVLAVGSVAAYYLSLDPATAAHDASLVDAGLALAERIRMAGGVTTADVPPGVEQVLRTDKYDKVFYVVRDPAGKTITGDADIPLPPSSSRVQDSLMIYDAVYRDDKVRAA